LATKSRRVTASALAAAGGLLALSGSPVATARPALPGPDSVPVVPAVRTVTPVAPVSAAREVHSRMSLAQRVGQLFMVGTPATSADAATLAQISRYHVGNAMLTGRSYGGTRTPSRVAAALQARATQAATAGVRLLVSTDQEGGAVQVLRGSGISQMPSALAQGRWTTAELRTRAGAWARQLRAAGVNMNLAPVMDTVPDATAARHNPPIGGFQREFGFTPTRVASHGTAFAQGMTANGVVPTIKHFPGLGRVTGNTDVSSGVTDRVTRRGDAYLRPFHTAIDAGVPVVMMSTAYYSRLDARNPAAFSPFIIRTVLRGDLGFRGVVISDDLANARQVARWSAAARAVKFVGAGGDLVLTVSPSKLPAMYDAVLHRAQRNATFRAKVNSAALRVLQAKERRHLLGR
jgi:beta-N-acetylhexosaminidase